MSFADLRSARKQKEDKSFVAASTKTDPESGSTDGDAARAPADVLEKSIPSGLKLSRDGYTGRGLYATEDIQSGSVLISCQPQVSVLSTQCLDSYCSYCCKPPKTDAELRRCTRCRVVWYCDSICQNHDWTSHKHECSSLQRWKTSAPSEQVAIPNEAIRCLGRIVWTIQKEGQDSVWARWFNAMQSHRTSLPSSATESHTHLAHALVQYLRVASPADLASFGFSSAVDLVNLISRFTTNTFTLTTASLTPIGVCVSPLMALVNHSCDPNAVTIFPHVSSSTAQLPCIQLTAIKDLKQGEQIFASYIDVTLPREIRQRDLKQTYNFTCMCSLCSQDDAQVDPRMSIRCPKACGGTCPAPLEDSNVCRCNKCGSILVSTDAIVDALRVGQEALDKATFVQFQDPTKAMQLMSKMIPILVSVGVLPSSHPLLAMHRLHLELLVSSLSSQLTQESLDEAIRAAAKYNAGLSNVLRKGHPVRGVAIAELGKLLAVDEPSPASPDQNPQSPSSTPPVFPPSGPARLRLAHETLTRASEELAVGFGKGSGGGEVGQEVRKIILRLEGEFGAWTHGVKNVLADARASRR